MKGIAAAVLPTLILLLSCADIPPPATEEEETAAARDYIDCLGAAAQKLDDGSSDASSVALGILPDCAAQFAHFVEVYGRGMNAVTFAKFREKEEQRELQDATAMVLKVRSLKNHPDSN